MAIEPRKAVEQTPVYVPGMRIDEVQQKYGLDEIIKLSSNENALGPPQSALEAARQVLATMNRYPDPSSTALKKTISHIDSIPEENILISHGLEEMIPAFCRAYINPGDESIQPKLTFIKYEIGVTIMDGTCIKIPMRHFEIDLDGMLEAITDKTKIIWLCNPNNPTGTYIPEPKLLNFLNQVPDHILVVHDETYRNFVQAEDFPYNTVPLLRTYPNLVIMRSLSKSHGLAGFRCGYLAASKEIVDNVFRMREIFCVDSVSAAAAEAALNDHAYLDHVQAVISQGRSYLQKKLSKYSPKLVRIAKSQANFIYLETPFSNKPLFEYMLSQGVIVRPIGSHGIRITVGLPNENHAFLKVFDKALHMHHPHISHHGESA